LASVLNTSRFIRFLLVRFGNRSQGEMYFRPMFYNSAFLLKKILWQLNLLRIVRGVGSVSNTSREFWER
jgi:hypothetical protein